MAVATAHEVDTLAWAAVFGSTAEDRGHARFDIRTRAAAAGIRPASIHDLYLAMGRNDASGFTVPKTGSISSPWNEPNKRSHTMKMPP